jgi:hypothetical protein
MSSFTKAAGIGAFADGIKATTPEGTLDALVGALGTAFPQMKDALGAAKTAAEGAAVSPAAEPGEGTEEA